VEKGKKKTRRVPKTGHNAAAGKKEKGLLVRNMQLTAPSQET